MAITCNGMKIAASVMRQQWQNINENMAKWNVEKAAMAKISAMAAENRRNGMAYQCNEKQRRGENEKRYQ